MYLLLRGTTLARELFFSGSRLHSSTVSLPKGLSLCPSLMNICRPLKVQNIPHTQKRLLILTDSLLPPSLQTHGSRLTFQIPQSENRIGVYVECDNIYFTFTFTFFSSVLLFVSPFCQVVFYSCSYRHWKGFDYVTEKGLGNMVP
jgi:hypothetical protein